jgi:hypothetical protein
MEIEIPWKSTMNLNDIRSMSQQHTLELSKDQAATLIRASIDEELRVALNLENVLPFLKEDSFPDGKSAWAARWEMDIEDKDTPLQFEIMTDGSLLRLSCEIVVGEMAEEDIEYLDLGQNSLTKNRGTITEMILKLTEKL